MKRRYHVALRVGQGTDIFDGISAFLAEKGVQWAFTVGASTALHLEALQRQQCDGLIIKTLDVDAINAVASLQKPCVNVAYCPTKTVPVVCTDQEAIGRKAAEYFLARGLKRFAYVGSTAFLPTIVREKGFQKALRRAGHRHEAYHPRRSPYVWSGMRTDLAAWLRRLPLPAGLLATSDWQAHNVLEACRDAGIQIPDQLAVLGTGNDLKLCLFSNPTLSSVPYSEKTVGYEAAFLLHRLMEGQHAPAKPILVPPLAVVVRGSTETGDLADPNLAQAIDFIEEHACDPITVADVMKKACMARRTLERHFREVIGRSPHEEIRRVQIDHARKLLVESRLPIQDVARSSGFARTWDLYAAFRKSVGMPPGEFRKRFGLAQGSK